MHLTKSAQNHHYLLKVKLFGPIDGLDADFV